MNREDGKRDIKKSLAYGCALDDYYYAAYDRMSSGSASRWQQRGIVYSLCRQIKMSGTVQSEYSTQDDINLAFYGVASIFPIGFSINISFIVATSPHRKPSIPFDQLGDGDIRYIPTKREREIGRPKNERRRITAQSRHFTIRNSMRTDRLVFSGEKYDWCCSSSCSDALARTAHRTSKNQLALHIFVLTICCKFRRESSP